MPVVLRCADEKCDVVVQVSAQPAGMACPRCRSILRPLERSSGKSATAPMSTPPVVLRCGSAGCGVIVRTPLAQGERLKCPRCAAILVAAQPVGVPRPTLELPAQPPPPPPPIPPAPRATLDLPTAPPGVTLDLPSSTDATKPSASATAATKGSASTVAEHPRAIPLGPMPTKIGRFEIRRFLGEGGFGRVFEAYDPSLKRQVALKVARPEQMQTPERVERFVREARSAGKLMHPHVVAVFDSGQDGPQHYIASAFIPGRPLDRVLREHEKGLDAKTAATIVRKLAEALAYAHREGIIHRDVKPGNVMLRDDGEPMLMDFGLAARQEAGEERLTQGQTSMGTPAFMAPEQARGEAVTASDQYSLGVALFELLTGHLPFEGGSPAHFLVLHESQQPPSPRSLRADVPRDLEAICLKCLEKEPAKRYADCQALADDLKRWLDGETVTARLPSRTERLIKWARRNPAVARLTALAAVLLIAGTTVSTVLALVASEQAREAKKKGALAEQRKLEAESALDQTEEALAGGFLAPLGHQSGPITPSELGALWRLTRLSPERNRVRLRFFDQALDDDWTATQLERRAPYAVQAAVGLDPDLRDGARTVLLKRLKDEKTTWRPRRVCAVVGTSLALDDPEWAGASAPALVEAMKRTESPTELHGLIVSLVKLVPGLGAEKARPHCQVAAERVVEVAQGQAARESSVLPPTTEDWKGLSDAVALLAPHLPAEQAARASAALLPLLFRESARTGYEGGGFGGFGALGVGPLGGGGLQLGGGGLQLGGGGFGGFGGGGLQLGGGGFLGSGNQLGFGGGLGDKAVGQDFPELAAPLAPWLDDKGKAAATASALDLVEKTKHEEAQRFLVKAATPVFDSLDSPAAGKTTARCIDRLNDKLTTDPEPRIAWAEVAAAAIPRLAPTERAKVAHQVLVSLLNSGLYLGYDRQALSHVKTVVGTLLAFLDRAGMRETCFELAAAREKGIPSTEVLAAGLVALADKLPREQAATLIEPEADRLVAEAKKNEKKPNVAIYAAPWALLATHLEAKKAGPQREALVGLLVDAIKAGPYSTRDLVRVLVDVARGDRSATAKSCREVATHLEQRLLFEKADDDLAGAGLAEQLAMLSECLDQAGVVGVGNALLARLEAVSDAKKPQPLPNEQPSYVSFTGAQMAELSDAFVVVVARLAAKDAASQCDKAAGLVQTRMGRSLGLTHLVRALGRAAEKLDPAAAEAVAVRLRGAMGDGKEVDVAGLAEAVGKLAGRMDREAARRHCTPVSDRLRKTLASAKVVGEMQGLLQAVDAVADHLGPARATDDCQMALGRFLDVMAPSVQLDTSLQLLSPGIPGNVPVKRLCQRLGREEARAISPRLIDLLSQTSSQEQKPLSDGLVVLLPHLSRETVLELLKRPTSVEPARTHLLAQLGRQAGRQFRTVWEVTAWAAENAPELNTRSAPSP